MGTWFSKIHNLFTGVYVPPPSCKILFLGLDGAGKTTILYQIKLNVTIQTISTIGFNVETIDPINDTHFTVWDVCGQENDRPFWRHFFQNVLGFVFVVDSSDIDRLEEARNELYTVVNREENKDIPFVVIANKQDLPNALNPSELVDSLDMCKLTNTKWHINGACATTGEGLHESLKALTDLIKNNRTS